MLAIRHFEDQRKAWESEREELEQRERILLSEKEQAEQQLAELHEEIERLQSTQAAGTTPACARQGPVEPREHIRSRHEQQLALMAKIDDLRGDLQQEQERSRALEQRASKAERMNRRLSAELDRSREFPGSAELDCTWNTATGSRRPCKATSSSSDAHDELNETRHSLESSRREVVSLEDETLRLREELNGEKQKVIELKRAAHSRGAAWKEELQKITEELTIKQRLEEEVAHLRLEQARFRKELDLLTEREVGARREAARLQQEVVEARAAKQDARSEVAEKVEEMQILSTVVGGQLVAVEQELTQQMKKSSQLLELFLHRAHEPLAVLRRSCQRIASSGVAGEELWTRAVPPLFEANVHDLHANLSKIVDLLRFVADVLEARERQQQEDQQHQQQRDPGVYERLEEGKEYAKAWMKPFLT